jgi:hypothetical protein
MQDSSPRFSLPFLLPGQAQKEHFHNEALLRLDALTGACAVAALAAPPANPADGDTWIVAPPGEGAWAGRDNQLACWTQSGWRFIAPVEGLEVWNAGEGLAWRWTQGAWNAGELHGSALFIGGLKVVGERSAAVPSPSGGTIIDVEARAAIEQIIVALMSHGLID